MAIPITNVDVPTFFLCPISLDVMCDPVTLVTGITYDRDSIERWIFSSGRQVCPVTRRPLNGDQLEPTPNHILRRIIQAWCVNHGVERPPTPRPLVDRSDLTGLLNAARNGDSGVQFAALKKLGEIVADSDRNRRCVMDSGAAHFALSMLRSASTPAAAEVDEQERLEEALSVLNALKFSEAEVASLVLQNGDVLDTFTTVLARSTSCKARTHAVLLLKSTVSVIAPARLLAASDKLFAEVVRVIRERMTAKATNAALQVLCMLCPWGRNRAKAAQASAVLALVELLFDAPEQRTCELTLAALAHVCQCSEGRQELADHPAGLAAVSKKMLRVSPMASERAVRVVHYLAKFSPTAAVLREMEEAGVVRKLFLVAQMGEGVKTREKATEILKMHSRVWRNSPCLDAWHRSTLFPHCHH